MVVRHIRALAAFNVRFFVFGKGYICNGTAGVHGAHSICSLFLSIMSEDLKSADLPDHSVSATGGMDPERRKIVERSLKRKLDARCSIFVFIYIMSGSKDSSGGR